MAVCGSMFPFWPRIDPRLNQTFKGIIFVGTGVSHYFDLPFKVPGLGLQGLKSGTSVWCFNRQYQRNLYETVLKNIPVQWTKEIVGMPFVGLQFLHWIIELDTSSVSIPSPESPIPRKGELVLNLWILVSNWRGPMGVGRDWLWIGMHKNSTIYDISYHISYIKYKIS